MRGPSHDLQTIQALVAAGDWTATKEVLGSLSALGFDSSDIVSCVASLALSDFHKTMESDRIVGQMLDVYRPMYEGIPIYLKFKRTDKAVVLSFKRDEGR
jgi:hypothetical protein